MEALTLGPLFIPFSRLPALTALIVLIVCAEVFNKKYKGLSLWAWLTVLASAFAARLVYAATSFSSYLSEPLSLLYFWQPGYNPLGAWLASLALAGWFIYKKPNLRKPLIGIWLAAAFTFIVLSQLFNIATASASLPQMKLYNLNDEQINLADLSNKPTLINLWASWCPPCKREMPLLSSYAEDPRFNLVLINQGESSFTLENFIRANNLYFLPTSLLLDQQQQAGGHFTNPGLPATYFYSAEGKLVERHFGELSRAQIDKFLQEYAR